MAPSISVLITDLDNTLYDWVAMWGASFNAMLSRLVEMSGVPQDVLEAEAQAIHQRVGTSEYAFLIQELPSLKAKHPGEDLRAIYAPAIDDYRKARDAHLKLYPTVADTLRRVKDAGGVTVGYTESRAFYTNYRVRRLALDGLLDYLFSPPDHALPADTSLELVRSRPAQDYELVQTVHRFTPEGELKPNPRLLKDIMGMVGALPERTVYVGDSLMKDVLMAQDAGVVDAFAKYGLAQHRDEYALLRRVTHWKPEDVEREKRLTAHSDVHPTYTLERAFGELLEICEFRGSRCVR
jgi:phosphoglycolate phosphatase